MSWLKIKEIIILKSLLLLYTTMKHFLIGLWHAMKSGLYKITGDYCSMTEPISSSKALSKAKVAPKKGHGHFWWSATSLIHYHFLNPGETITSEKYAQQIRDVSRIATLVASSGQWKEPNSSRQCPAMHCTKASEVEQIGLQSFTSFVIFTWFLSNQHPLLQASRNCFPRVHQILKHGLLCCRNKQTYFSLAKMCWL